MRVVSLAVPLVVCMAAPSGAGELPTAPAEETAKARLELYDKLYAQTRAAR